MNFWEQIPRATKIFFLIFMGLVYLLILLIFWRSRSYNSEDRNYLWFLRSNNSPMEIIPSPELDAPKAVTVGKVSIFNGPGEDFDIIGLMEEGVEAQVIGISEDRSWFAIKVDIGQEQIGWLRSGDSVVENVSELQIIDSLGNEIKATTSTPMGPFVSAVIEAKIFNGPGLEYEEIGVLEIGKTADVIGISQSGKWWIIRLPFLESGRGYVSAENVLAENTDNVQVEEIPVVTAVSNVNVRNGPGMDYEKIGLLKSGQKANVIGRDSDGLWWVIQIPDLEENGWSSVDYVVGTNLGNVPIIRLGEIEIDLLIPTPSIGAPGLSATADVNIRSGPGVKYNVINKLKYGQIAEVVGKSFDGEWWAIRILNYENEYGWVSSQFADVESAENVPNLK